MKRVITPVEVTFLNEQFGRTIPQKLLSVLRGAEVIGDSFELSEQEDASGLGVEMRWMTPEEQVEEAFKFYPGIPALKKKYVPIGICLQGSGDPYFIKDDHGALEVYRIPHDSVVDKDIDESKIEYVCGIETLIKKLV